MRSGWILLCFLLLCAGAAQAQISPGALSKAHAFLNGPLHCVDCHDIAKQPPEFKCLGCHRDIRERLESKTGLHPSLVGADRSGQSCAQCHSEHNGRDFNIIHWDKPLREFDHHRAGYGLEGRHGRAVCKDCHQPARIPAEIAATLSVKDLNRTFLGLPRKCESCHTDEHRGQLSPNCDRCHDFSGWKSGVRFNHGSARFILAGRHEKLACEKCHAKADDPKPFAKYKDLSFQDCTPCHADPHRGAFRATCSSCHSPLNWKPYQVSPYFNHATTAYPLEGKHSELNCSSCHKQGDFKEPVAHARCTDCHRRDPHRGQFSNLTDAGDCSSCHTAAGFKPSTFTVERHSKTPYPLAARHAGVPCTKCHLPKGPDTVFRISDTSCFSCHIDAHKGQFLEPPNRNRCESCHNFKGFRPSTFTLARHRTARFTLPGAHEAVVCMECHKSSESGFPPPPAKFRFDDRSCTACHADPHQGQFARRMARVRADGSPAGCEACHSSRSWRELSGFDHANTAFPLAGAHRAVLCEQCHKSGNLETGMKRVVFSSAAHQCSSCHEDIHGGQFARRMDSGDCGSCHQVLKWKPSKLNHDNDTTYPLTGSHKNVRCALCHKSIREMAGRRVLLYRNAPRECIACHGTEKG